MMAATVILLYGYINAVKIMLRKLRIQFFIQPLLRNGAEPGFEILMGTEDGKKRCRKVFYI